ncbi:MAG TPA: ferredoxin [Acidimicrobiia bacterium]|nr:ferredoxin [Acidimicrobiia bacterium]
MARVWINTDACMGAGTCAQVVPAVFHERQDGIWAVKEDPSHFDRMVVFDGLTGDGHGPDGHQGRARVPEPLLELVLEAAEECPGECIFVEA